jgi:hypothetical protein
MEPFSVAPVVPPQGHRHALSLRTRTDRRATRRPSPDAGFVRRTPMMSLRMTAPAVISPRSSKVVLGRLLKHFLEGLQAHVPPPAASSSGQRARRAFPGPASAVR